MIFNFNLIIVLIFIVKVYIILLNLRLLFNKLILFLIYLIRNENKLKLFY